MRRTTATFVLPLSLVAVGLLLGPVAVQAATITFDDLSLDPGSYWNGSSKPGWGDAPFKSGAATFNNHYDEDYPAYPYWDGWSCSNMTDTTTAGYGNQYSAISGSGVDGSSNYGVGYLGFWGRLPSVVLDEPGVVAGAYFTNTTYAYLAMADGNDGNSPAKVKRFGYRDSDGDGDYDDSGDYNGTFGDYFLLTITGKNAGGADVGAVDFYLADFRSPNSVDDYVIGDWTWVDLSSLGEVASLEFTLDSTDSGMYGINTPTYFAMDNLTLAAGVPEPTTLVLFLLAAAGLLIGRLRR